MATKKKKRPLPPKKRKPKAKPRKPTTIQAALAQMYNLQMQLTKVQEEMAKQKKVMEDMVKERDRLKAEAEALRAAAKPEPIPVREPTPQEVMRRLKAKEAGLPEGFKVVEEEAEPISIELVRERELEIDKYLADLTAQLRFEEFSVHPRATYKLRDNSRAEGEIVVNVPRGMPHRHLGANIGRIIGSMGALKGRGIWITTGWYFDITSGEERDRYLRYRGGYAAFAYPQHANTTGEMATNLLTAEGMADSYQEGHRHKKPVAIIFRLVWSIYRDPSRLSGEVWDRNGGQAPTV